MSEHSPLPWCYSRERNCIDTGQLDKDGFVHDKYSIYCDDEDWPDDAAFIVQCVNEREALLAERDELRAFVQDVDYVLAGKGTCRTPDKMLEHWALELCTKARALLARKDTA